MLVLPAQDHSGGANIEARQLRDAIELKARELGFDWFGVAAAEALGAERKRLEEWLAAGRHGDMKWLETDPARRSDPGLVVEGCRSVIVLGMNYLRESLPPPESAGALPPAGLGRVSKYARTRDYHRVIEKRLRKLAAFIDGLDPTANSRSYVDYGPVMERPWAERGGIGFAGKHTLLINPAEGSFHFLGAVLTTAEVAADAPRAMPGCGNCRRCIDACPTGAITEPWKLDATRCLSYLTIEKQGPVDEEFWPNYRGLLFGCDICQDVCPYNQSRARPVAESALGDAVVAPTLSLATLIKDADGFLAGLGETSSPLRRAGADSLTRNAIIVASTNANDETRAALETLAEEEARPEWLRELARRVLAMQGA
ncbi:tRNA epoxyqueuosine(34) reductase QueG [soil metagenome]